jgi:hypothetical protein
MKPDRNKKIEEILESLDNCQRATVPDFFYTRLKAKMENAEPVVSRKPLILKPVFAVTALALVLILNAFVIFQRNNMNAAESTAITDTDVLQSMAVEYRLNDNSAIPYDINLER